MKGILLDENGEYMLEGGIIKVGDAYGQTVENVLRANRGEFKAAPLVGGETTKMMGGTPGAMWGVAVKKQLQSVGLPVSRVDIADNEITVKL